MCFHKHNHPPFPKRAQAQVMQIALSAEAEPLPACAYGAWTCMINSAVSCGKLLRQARALCNPMLHHVKNKQQDRGVVALALETWRHLLVQAELVPQATPVPGRRVLSSPRAFDCIVAEMLRTAWPPKNQGGQGGGDGVQSLPRRRKKGRVMAKVRMLAWEL